jgi:hypothetical protein
VAGSTATACTDSRCLRDEIDRSTDQGRIYHLRGSEVELLERAAQYRVTFTEDLKQDAGDANRFKDDLRSLKEQGLIEERS